MPEPYDAGEMPEPKPDISVRVRQDQLEDALATAAAEVLKRYFAPPPYPRSESGPGWSEIERKVAEAARVILASRNLRPIVEAALDAVQDQVVREVAADALKKHLNRLIKDKPGLVLERAAELLGRDPAPALPLLDGKEGGNG